MTERDRMMRQVQMYALAAHDAALFLDSHPRDRQALDYFRKMNVMHERARKDFSERFGPLNVRDSGNELEEWDWIKGPWPWMHERTGER